MTTEQQYLADLERALRGLPKQTQQAILDDVRAHFADAAEQGRSVEATIAALGSPEQVAAAAREELGLPAETPDVQATRAGRLLQWSALALGVLTAVFVTFMLPRDTASMNHDNPGASLEEQVYTTSTLFSELGVAAGLLPLLPAALALLPLVLRGRAATLAGWIVPPVVTVACFVVDFTYGAFFLPMALLLGAALFVPIWLRGPRSRASARAWRIVGGVIIASPAIFLALGTVSGSLMDAGLAFWIPAFILVVLGVLFALRMPFVDVLIAALGLALMLLAVFDGGMLFIALWWAGGLWLVVGLVGLAARGSIR